MRVVIPVSFNPDTDADILDWLQSQAEGERSAAIRAALRSHLDQQSITLADVYHAIMELKRRAVVAVNPAAPASVEDPEITDNLDSLLNL